MYQDEGQYYSDMGAAAEYEAALGYAAQAEAEQAAYQEISIAWVSWVEQRLVRSLLSSEQKEKLRKRLEVTGDENEVKSILATAEANQPIMGLEVIPQGQGKEMGEAIRLRVERDDFYDRYDNKVRAN